MITTTEQLSSHRQVEALKDCLSAVQQVIIKHDLNTVEVINVATRLAILEVFATTCMTVGVGPREAAEMLDYESEQQLGIQSTFIVSVCKLVDDILERKSK